MNVLTDKFSFSDGFVFIDSKTAKIDWDEMDLQLFDGTSTVQPDIAKYTEVDDIAKVLGISTETATVGVGNSESNPLDAEDLAAILGGSTVAGVSVANFNQPLELYLSNDDVAETQSADFSSITGVKEVHL